MKELNTRQTLSGAAQALSRWAAVRRYERADPARTERLLLGRLRRVVDHAFDKVPFYRDLYRNVGYTRGALRAIEDLSHLPTVSKRDFKDLPVEAITSRAVPRRHLLPSVTSGTSGELLTVWHDARRLGELGLAILRVTGLVAPHRPWHRMLYVYTSRFPVTSVLGLFPMTFVPTTASPERIEAEWRRVRPDVVWIYPSRLKDLIEGGLEAPRTRLISVGSELSTPQERLTWEDRLGSPVRDQYATEELGLVAAECRHRSRHAFSDLCHTEILGPDGRRRRIGEVGEVVGTNLENLATPFIRYRQGDRAAVRRSRCPCGRTLRILDPIEGRSRVTLVTQAGEPVGSGVLIDALYGLVLQLRLPLRGYRLVAGTPPTLLLAGDVSDRQAAAAADFVLHETGLAVSPRIVRRLPDGAAGKRETVIGPASNSHGSEVEDVEDDPAGDVGG